jgi:hypothetical protein
LYEKKYKQLTLYGIQVIASEGFRSSPRDRKQKVKIKSPTNTQNFSNWETKHADPQEKILGPLLFIIHIELYNILPTINTLPEHILYADLSRQNFDDFSRMSNTANSHMIKWFAADYLSKSNRGLNTGFTLNF